MIAGLRARILRIVALAALLLVCNAATATATSTPSVPRSESPAAGLPGNRTPLPAEDWSWTGQVGATIIGAIAVLLCVLIHFESLLLLSALMRRPEPIPWLHVHVLPRIRIMLLIVGLMLIHMIEVWVFAFGFWLVDGLWHFGYLLGDPDGHRLLDYAYFSFVCYTTLGFGDIIPVGPVRFLTALESLLGLVLIGWSASFTYLSMHRYWSDLAEVP